jgi:hypothetical protein
MRSKDKVDLASSLTLADEFREQFKDLALAPFPAPRPAFSGTAATQRKSSGFLKLAAENLQFVCGEVQFKQASVRGA